jgi:hypothetical protein
VCVSPVQLTDGRVGGRGGRGAESYDRKKASINPADVFHLQLYLCDSDITFLYVQYVLKVLRSVEINHRDRVKADRKKLFKFRCETSKGYKSRK